LEKNKILLIGPIGDFGGRELEAGFIANALNEEYDVKVCSTVYCTEQSQIFDFVTKKQMSSLAKLVVDKYFQIKLIALVAYFRFGFKYSIPYFFNNKISKKYGAITHKITKVLEELILGNDAIIICAQLSSNYLKEIIDFAYFNNIPVLFRTTGTIDDNCANYFETKFSWLKKITIFIHNSNINAKKLDGIQNYKYETLDQCAFNEKELIICPNKENKISNFFVLSRLSQEKQVDVVIKAFNNIGQPTDYLHIYGTGPELEALKRLAKNNKNIIFYGYISHTQSHELFYKHDCLVISSSEEAGPLTGVEAMAAGVPLISTKVGAMPERLLNYDFWYDGSQEQLELKMKEIKMLSSSEVSVISKKIKQRYIEKYSIGSIKRKYQNVVNKTLFSS